MLLYEKKSYWHEVNYACGLYQLLSIVNFECSLFDTENTCEDNLMEDEIDAVDEELLQEDFY